MEELLSNYTEAFRNMKRAALRGYTAPHKPILLLSVMQLVEEGAITTNKISLDEALINKFSWMWTQYVDDGGQKDKMMVADGLEFEIVRKYPFKCRIENPFFHMQSEAFWSLIPSADYEKRSGYNLHALKRCFDYAEIDTELFSLFQDEKMRKKLNSVLLSMI